MLAIPSPDSVPDVADWVELAVASSGDALSRAATSAAIEAAGSESDDSFVTDVWRELDSRRSMYARPAFDVNDRVVEPSAETPPSPDYKACLILSLFGVRDNDLGATRLFERLCCKAVESYLSGALVVGWPPEGEETTILERFRSIAVELKEKFVEAPPGRFKDRGVDVVGWKAFSDGRSGQVVVLVQCAAGRHWKVKQAVPIEAWGQYFHWACAPVRGFAVPCIVSATDWHEGSTDKGLILDRVRIVNLLHDRPADEALAEELRAWVSKQLTELG